MIIYLRPLVLLKRNVKDKTERRCRLSRARSASHMLAKDKNLYKSYTRLAFCLALAFGLFFFCLALALQGALFFELLRR